jgi:hypothetical protein
MRSSQAADQAGVNVQTLRYYERRGLLAQPERSGSGYRSYDTQAVRTVRFVKRAHEDLDGLLERMHRRNVNSVLVTDPEGRLLGIFHRDDGDAVAGRGLA